MCTYVRIDMCVVHVCMISMCMCVSPSPPAPAVEEDSDAERVLVAFGYGANLPTTSKRRLQQSVQLARRVLHLERVCSSLRRQVEEEEGRVKQLSSEVCCTFQQCTSTVHHKCTHKNYERDGIHTTINCYYTLSVALQYVASLPHPMHNVSCTYVRTSSISCMALSTTALLL